MKENIKFYCTLCEVVLSPKFTPNTIPSCPSCGSKTIPEENEIKKICNNCHKISYIYSSNKCEKCNTQNGSFSGSEALQNHESALKGKRTLYSSSRGPEGGTIPRWKVY